jgi:hypothetical protein
MTKQATATLSPEHADFFARFRSFWAAPTGERVREIIAPDAVIHFSGLGTFSGEDYVGAMCELLATSEDLHVTAVDCAGEGELLYIFWNAASRIGGEMRRYHGVDRFRLRGGMAIEEHIIFDTAVLQAG